MAANSGKGAFQPDPDVHISFDDQQRINIFAKLNAKLEDLKEEVKVKTNDLKSLEDACDEIALFDDDEEIPYLVGEIFVYQNVETTQRSLEDAKEKIGNEISLLTSKCDEIKDQMSALKAHLYGKFGNLINLEADE